MTRKIRILITEDNVEIMSGLSSSLSSQGISVTSVSRDAKKVLDLLKSPAGYDAALIDLNLANFDAIYVITEAQKISPATKILVMSAFVTTSLERQVAAAGGHYLFLKPFDIRSVTERIISLVAGDMDPLPAPLGTVVGESDLEILVSEIMHQIGVPAHIKGYQYLRDSIIKCIYDTDYINAVTKRLYPDVAKQFFTTSSRVERAIRHAIEVAWDRGDVDVLNSFFGYTIHNCRGKPTNSEFIAMISDKLRLKLRSSTGDKNTFDYALKSDAYHLAMST